MFHPIYPNRLFLYTVGFIIAIFLILIWQISLYNIEQDLAFGDNEISYTIHLLKKQRAYSSTPGSSTLLTAANNFDISKWKTYRNEKYGFEFRYPKNPKVIATEITGENDPYPSGDYDAVVFVENESEENFKQGIYFARGTHQEIINGKLVNRSVQTGTTCFFNRNKSYCFDLTIDLDTQNKIFSTVQFFEPKAL